MSWPINRSWLIFWNILALPIWLSLCKLPQTDKGRQLPTTHVDEGETALYWVLYKILCKSDKLIDMNHSTNTLVMMFMMAKSHEGPSVVSTVFWWWQETLIKCLLQACQYLLFACFISLIIINSLEGRCYYFHPILHTKKLRLRLRKLLKFIRLIKGVSAIWITFWCQSLCFQCSTVFSA